MPEQSQALSDNQAGSKEQERKAFQLSLFKDKEQKQQPDTIRCIVTNFGSNFVAVPAEGYWTIGQGATKKDALSDLKKRIIAEISYR